MPLPFAKRLDIDSVLKRRSEMPGRTLGQKEESAAPWSE